MKKELDTNPHVGKYTPFIGYQKLRELCAKKMEKDCGLKVNPNREIYVTCGAMEGVATSLLTLVDPGDEVILLAPAFSSHIE